MRPTRSRSPLRNATHVSLSVRGCLCHALNRIFTRHLNTRFRPPEFQIAGGPTLTGCPCWQLKCNPPLDALTLRVLDDVGHGGHVVSGSSVQLGLLLCACALRMAALATLQALSCLQKSMRFWCCGFASCWETACLGLFGRCLPDFAFVLFSFGAASGPARLPCAA